MAKVGELAPDFQLDDQFGKPFQLSEALKSGPVVLYFYPSDYTPVCTLESIAFREFYEEFRAAGADVVGVSDNSPESHQKFCGSMKLPFRLLTDHQHEVRNTFKTVGLFGRHASRVTYVIDVDRTILMIYKEQLRPKEHAKRAAEVIKTLASHKK